MGANWIEGMFSQCRCVSDHCAVHFKCIMTFSIVLQ